MMKITKLLRNIYTHPLSAKAKWRATKRLVSWQVSSRLAPGRILVDWIGGSKFLCSRGEAGLTGNVYNGLSDFEDMGFLLHFLRPEDCFFDIGANAGSYTLLASKVTGARTFSFEPVPSTFERLRMNCIVNQVTNLVRLENCALGDERSVVDFSEDHDCMNHVLPQSTPTSVKVNVRKADEFVEESPALLKIDVEGFEFSVLKGATSVLEASCLKAIIIELNGSGARFGIPDIDVAAILRSHRFLPAKYSPWERKLEELSNAVPDTGNRLFVRDFEFVASRCDSGRTFDVFGIKI